MTRASVPPLDGAPDAVLPREAMDLRPLADPEA
jgi:hypothetical protein